MVVMPRAVKMLDDGVVAQSQIFSLQRSRHLRMAAGHTLDVALVDQRLAPGDGRVSVTLPVEGRINDDRLGDKGSAVARAGYPIEIMVIELAHSFMPDHRAVDRGCQGIDEQTRRVESQPLRGIPGAVDSIAIELAGGQIGNHRFPDSRRS